MMREGKSERVVRACACVALLLLAASAGAGANARVLPHGYRQRCMDVWDEECAYYGQLVGGGGGAPGERYGGRGEEAEEYAVGGGAGSAWRGGRCVNMWDEGCVNGQLAGAGNDDNYLGGSFNPGKRALRPLPPPYPYPRQR